jgi:hypothetical protein
MLPTRPIRCCFTAAGRCHLSGGAAVPAAGRRLRGLEGYSGGEKAQESSGRQTGATRGRRERTHRGSKASKRVKLAERAAYVRWSRATGKWTCPRKGKPIAAGGTRQLRESVGVGETGGEKAAEERRPARRWMTAREPVASRGVHDRCEGKALKGGSPGTVAACNKAVELEQAEAAERLRKPESGTGAGLDSPSHAGPIRGCR